MDVIHHPKKNLLHFLRFLLRKKMYVWIVESHTFNYGKGG